MATSKWKTHVADRLETIRAWKMSGLTDAEIANNLGINPTTLSDYKKAYASLANVLKTGKEDAVAQVVNALHLRAIGYEYEEVHITKKRVVIGGGDGEDGTEITRKTIKKLVLPDVAAMIFYLKNRDYVNWRDRKELTGKDGEPLTPKSSNVHIFVPDNGMDDGDNSEDSDT